MTTADGRALHYMVAGSGEPTVVFESGMGFSRTAWGLVQPLVAQRFRSVVYDRANLGRSDDDHQPRTLERITGDLDALLAALGSGPYILVGHSYGGSIALASTVADPSRIAGVVLIDHSDENLDAYYRPASRGLRLVGLLHRAALDAMGRVGVLPHLVRRMMPRMPRDVLDDMVSEDLTSRARRAADEEDRRFVAGMTGLRDNPPVLDGIPVTVISGARAEFFNEETRSELNAAHQLTARRLGARHVVARKSGHQVVLTEPGLIADEVFRIADA
ncbi:alpha/beta fold hydrolase [Mycobacteroides franklinii]|uniref:Alpha/beta hydrolase n=1 Tax=Mycobacteroides franklinii TaxID=948102 RepID=A0A4R5P948_9MYCO|nr:alpha/beta hydrolase [Mycobacteroides franklinii]ORA63635.1 alpha/beta hydrolase [Mycobacteroides franklinii]TDH19677.1 alpha/beta hydrolase [Mycobacteroides franklinii]